MVLPKGQDDWSKEDIVKLLERMENNIPSNDRHIFKTTQSQMDWEKVAFKDFSGEMCKLKWLEVSYDLRKFRTLKELVLEAKEDVNKSYKRRKHKKHPDLPKKHPDLPKKPLTAYLRFFKEMRPQYSQKHPKMSKQELTKVLSEEHKKLPEQLKLKYSQGFQKEKQEFDEKTALFREQHPDLVQNYMKSDVPKGSQTKAPKKFQGNVQKVKSPPENNLSMKRKFHREPEKPPMNGYHKFHQDLWSSRELQVLPLRERMVEISRRWQRVPQNQKEHYKKQAEELQKQYKVDLDLWLKSLSPEEYAAYREETYTKHKNMSMTRGPNPKVRRMDLQFPSSGNLQGGPELEQGLQAPEIESSNTIGEHSPASGRSEENKKGERQQLLRPQQWR
ncbi:upstream-binding factor 1-like protein 1 [Kogia breviceps]|uniref:upstream-binding factor 1-like protein 1 n=1 Tax=Kogia breviceps TaxID=27615 RepID=UPI002795907F|nr:upstream-binding factor 1-like protein 1 [Kogia breviceps]